MPSRRPNTTTSRVSASMTTWWFLVYRQFFDCSAMLWSRVGIRAPSAIITGVPAEALASLEGERRKTRLMMPSAADFDDRIAELTRAQPAERYRPDGCDAVNTPA